MLINFKYIIYCSLASLLYPFVEQKYFGLYKKGRQVGNTTRLIDLFIQEFFTKGECQIYDHYNTRESKERVFNLVLQRLYYEHHISKNDLFLDKKKFIIRPSHITSKNNNVTF